MDVCVVHTAEGVTSIEGGWGPDQGEGSLGVMKFLVML